MKSSQNGNVTVGGSGTAEETLRIIAHLPAPDGLVDRVQTRLRTAPRSARVLSWPSVFAPGGWGYAPALRGAAAAAIVCVVAGGGWRIYSRVQPAASARVVTMPAPASPGRGFSAAGSMHTPDLRPLPANGVNGESPQTGQVTTSGQSKTNPTKKTGKHRTGDPRSSDSQR